MIDQHQSTHFLPGQTEKGNVEEGEEQEIGEGGQTLNFALQAQVWFAAFIFLLL